MSTECYKVLVKQDCPATIVTGYTNTVLIGSGATVVNNVSGGTWIITSTLSGSTSWGDLVGTITNQTDLINYISGQTSGLTSSWSGLTGLPSDNADLVAYISGVTSGDTVGTLIGSGGTWAGLLSGDTWIVYSPDWTADILGLTMSAQTNYECCTGLTATFNDYTGDTFITLSGITVAGALLQAQTNNLQQAFTGHTGTTEIHTPYSAITFAISAATSGLTSSWSGLTGLPTDNADLMSVFSGYSLTGHVHTQYLTGFTVTCDMVTGCTDSLYLHTDALNGYWTSAQTVAYHTGNTPTVTWSGMTGTPAWLTGTTLASFETGHTHSQYLTGVTMTFSGLSDTVLTGVTNLDYVRFDSGATKWINEQPTDIFANVIDGYLLRRNGTAITGISSSYYLNTATANPLYVNVTGDTMTGLLTLNAGLTETGAVANLNVSSNFAVNIANGTSTGAIGIGNGASTQTIALGGATTKTITLGGATSINTSINSATNINAGTSTGKITLGGTGVQAIAIGDNTGVKTITIGSHATPANDITVGGTNSTTTLNGTVNVTNAADIFANVDDTELLARNGTAITGVTNLFSSKLNISVYTGYTGTTVPATYAKLYPVTKNVTGTTYTALAADVGKNIEFSNTGATTVTLPTGLTEGYEIRCINIGGQAITFAAGGGATVNSKAGNLKLITQYTTAQALYRGSNKWLVISPDLTA